jgi:magnesium-transporting ATPase (P-type)
VQWLFNLLLLGDGTFMLMAAISIGIAYTKFLIRGYYLFVLVWLYEAVNGINRGLLVNAFIIDSIIQIIAYAIVLYHTSMIYKGSLWAMPSLWLCIAVEIFYGCTLPFFSLLKVLKPPEMALLFNILMIIIAVRYFSTAISLWLYARQSTHKNTHK